MNPEHLGTAPSIDCFLLCDYVQVSGRKMNIIGGGWDSLLLPRIPYSLQFYIALQAHVPKRWFTDFGPSVALHCEFLRPDGRSIGPGSLTAEIDLGNGEDRSQLDTIVIQLPIAVKATFASVGRHSISLSFGKAELHRAFLEVSVRRESPQH